jgi:hypothetical protein
MFEGTPVLVGGGDWLSIAPAVSFTLGTLTLQSEIKIPVYRSLANRQLDAPFTFQAGVIWRVR